MRTLAFVICFLIISPKVFATGFVSTQGDDKNNCLEGATPCLTIQAAIKQATTNNPTINTNPITIVIGPGVYEAGADVHHYMFIGLLGDCDDPSKVVVRVKEGNAFNVQDHATMALKCLTIEAPNGAAITARQFAIADYQRVVFGPANRHISIKEMSKGNCLESTRIYGSAIAHISAYGLSSISSSCEILIEDGVNFNYFAQAETGSFINGGGGKIIGGKDIDGAQYVNSAGIIIPPADGFPGDATRNVCLFNCVVQD